MPSLRALARSPRVRVVLTVLFVLWCVEMIVTTAAPWLLAREAAYNAAGLP
jgi:hypothetical protein